MILRDYTYLDTGRLQNYLSSLDPGVVDELTEVTRSQTDKEGRAGIKAYVVEAGGGGRTENETTHERTMRITAQNMFSRVYEELEKADLIKVFDEDDSLELEGLRRREVVEVTRDFSPSPMNDAIDAIMSLMTTMEQMGFVEEINDEEAEMVRTMAMIFRGDEDNEELPMVSRGDQNTASVVFSARSKYILDDQSNFQGPMTVFGKVKKVIPVSQSLDLFDFLKLPSAVRNEATMKKELLEMFHSWPKELGGPIKKESMEVAGPAIVVTPVAVYEA